MSKILTSNTLVPNLKKWEDSGDRVVLATGVFDCLHHGHITLLQRAKQYGDVLLVGVNTDTTVRMLKGAARPYFHVTHRMVMLAELECVDAVVSFSQLTPELLIHTVKPHAYVKGGDYHSSILPEAAVVLQYGGAVILLPRVDGYSTTTILKDMR